MYVYIRLFRKYFSKGIKNHTRTVVKLIDAVASIGSISIFHQSLTRHYKVLPMCTGLTRGLKKVNKINKLDL